ncbi:DUF4376 domain-containing protein [Sporomusa sp.]|uniref:DUF4376 domain-containing protein n=1 Tax=Sporomusa sp. TaxID=2078658 RepID=UPI002C6230BD|nr:DUF4376 domain-containing protein [Sporomusa sp.]HWR42781.1 DUF4376 domain-containing protein [Sporomusa sp.]
MRYAQILNNKAHWIFESNETLEEIYSHRFSQEIVLVDITSNTGVKEGWDYDVSTGTFSEPNVITLDGAKTSKIAEMKTKRDTLEQSGFTYLGKVFDSDPKSVQRISVAVLAAQVAIANNQSLSFNWTLADNSTITMTAAEFVGLPIALAQHANELHEKYRALKEQIEACTTVAEVEAISWN